MCGSKSMNNSLLESQELAPLMPPSVSSKYSQASVDELMAFLSGTCKRNGMGTLPFKLAQRGPELLRLISEFVLEERSFFYMGSQDGHIGAVEAIAGKPLCVHRIAITCQSKDMDFDHGISMAQPLCQRQCSVHGLVSNGKWLVAATSCGLLHVFSLPTHNMCTKIAIGTPLPPQRPALLGDLAFVASKRAFFAVDLMSEAMLLKLPLLFSARPSLVVDPSAIFVQCDEVVRMWPLPEHPLSTNIQCKVWPPEPQDLRNPHRQMLVGMAVPTASNLLATLSHEEVRGWSWPRHSNSTAQLLWTVSLQVAGPEGLDSMFLEGVTLALVPVREPQEPLRLLVLGTQDGKSILRTIALPHGYTGEPVVSDAGEAVGTARDSYVAVQASYPEVLLRFKEGGWAVWSACRDNDQRGFTYTHIESLEMDASSITALGPALFSSASSSSEVDSSDALKDLLQGWAAIERPAASTLGTDDLQAVAPNADIAF
eukprot:TRINITY_DN53976_c0_g1_i1.p1 TRINITY_DN53976_c0_g1~~TRINITY_DN53976_c0_g1_i1.p1  ORF type:complete len:484 (+),score=28.06 TRINITY_DN53976_c0_g1_i1:225-1676(+)